MPGHASHQPHGSGIPEITYPSPTGRFGYLFPPVAPELVPDRLLTLAQAMAAGEEEPSGAPDKEESHIPAAYTYFGQFVDHDLTFDPSTFAQMTGGVPNPSLRTARFDLDSIYGRGPGDQPYLYQPDGRSLAVGDELVSITRNPDPRDLPRVLTGLHPTHGEQWRAIIGDPRNDENVIVSQLQGLFYRFHNRLAEENPDWSFEELRAEVLHYYQWIVVHDFLPLIVIEPVLDAISRAIRSENLSFRDLPPMTRVYDRLLWADLPYEFSVAAYRMGHSMVRPGYVVNENIQALPIFDPKNPFNGLNAFGKFPREYTIDWQRFIDLGLNPTNDEALRTQLAYKIDTSMVEPLANLPQSVAGDEAMADPRLVSLAYRNLLRGHLTGLPSGQSIARELGVPPLRDDQIWIGKAEGDHGDPNKEGIGAVPIGRIDGAFADNCPLWTYVLAESRHNFFTRGKAQLGEVGGRIVAETFLGLLKRDPNSIVNQPDWRPSLVAAGGRFTLANFIRYALGL